MNVEIGMRLADLRRSKGFSQEELANKLGLSRQAISKWERAESSPDTDNLIALAELYGVSLDELLKMSDEARSDAAFERETKSENVEDGGAHAGSTDAGAEASGAAASGFAAGTAAAAGFSTVGARGENVHIGEDGIGVEQKDGDYVHISLKDGIHVKDASKGDEVHVGWDGIHVNDGAANNAPHEAWTATDDEGNTVSVDKNGVDINGKHYDSWKEAHEDWHQGKDEGPGHALMLFPFPLLVILLYIIAGLLWGTWLWGLFLAFLIPVYYIIAAGIQKREIAPTLSGLYPLACLAVFLFLGFSQNLWHPAWVVFLTIPIAEWIIVAPSKAWKRHKAKKANTATDADVNQS